MNMTPAPAPVHHKPTLNKKICALCLGATAAALAIPLIQKLAGHAASRWPLGVAVCTGIGALTAYMRR